MKNQQLIWLNGEFLPANDAKVSVLVHGLHYASSFFEGIKSYYIDGRQVIYRLDDHLDRFVKSINAYNLELPYSKAEIKSAIIKLVQFNYGKNLYIRPCFFMGEGFKVIEINENMPSYLTISCWESNNEIPSDFSVGLVDVIRASDQTLKSKSKCAANYMTSQLIKIAATNNEFDDGIALDQNGYITECSCSNIFFVKNDTIYTPDLSLPILGGITRQSIIEIAQELSIPVVEGKFTTSFIDNEITEAFVSGTAMGITPITKLEKINLTEKAITNKLIKNLNEYRFGEKRKYQTEVNYESNN